MQVDSMFQFPSKSMSLGENHEGALKEHIERLMELSHEIVQDNLQRQQQRQKRIQAVQQRFMSWAEEKQTKIKEKLEKSIKLKEDHISKIAKKCQDTHKYLGEKLKNHQSKKKESLRQAWKMNQKYKSQSENNDRNFSKSKTLNNTKSLGQSQLLNLKKTSIERRKQFQTSNYEGGSFRKQENKNSQQSLKKIRQRRSTNPTRFLTEADEQYEEKEARKMQEKLQEAFSRFKHNLAEEQQTKIQQLGERFVKIEKGRNRRYEMLRKKKEKYQHFNEDDSQDLKRQKKLNKSQRVRSESVMRQKRVRDWSSVNKHKREQFFQTQIQNGNNYLQNSKLKFLKTTIAKKIALSTIQKKLYLQRLKH